MQLPRRHPFSSPFDRRAIERAIEKLHRTHRHRPFAGEPSPADLYLNRRRFARLIAHAIAAGTYRFSPAEVYSATIEGKPRVLYRSTAIDSVVERVVTCWLTPLVEPLLSPQLYSYRLGFSAVRAVREFGAYLRAYRRSAPTVRQRGLWVLRRDIARYGDSIPVGPGSAFWPQIDRALETAPQALRPIGRGLLGQMLARHCRDDDREFCLAVGTPTGSPIQPLVNNLYLSGLDRAMAGLDGFYARFGDDMLFATPSLAVAEQAQGLLADRFGALALQVNAHKRREIYLTAAARPPDRAGWRPATKVDFLGVAVAFRGGVSLSRAKWRRLLRLLQQRLRRAGGMLALQPPAEAAAALALLVRRSFNPADPLCLPYAELLAQVVDDREQLHDLDELLRRQLAELCSGKRGVRAFRQLPPRRLHQLGLPSLAGRRNRAHGRSVPGEPR